MALTQELLAAVRGTVSKDSPQLAESLDAFCINLLTLKAWDEAEPLLLDGYRGRVKEREATIAPNAKMLRIPEALERLVRLYEAKGNEPEAAAWRTKLEAARSE